MDGGAIRCQRILVSHFTCTHHCDLVCLLSPPIIALVILVPVRPTVSDGQPPNNRLGREHWQGSDGSLLRKKSSSVRSLQAHCWKVDRNQTQAGRGAKLLRRTREHKFWRQNLCIEIGPYMTSCMEPFSRRRWTTLPAPSVSYSFHEDEYFSFQR